uniref:DUF7745 domain-containing protein n=2 Tax=Cucumis melo TaxID=3656 RepID=A0A9I9CC82_CUCME
MRNTISEFGMAVWDPTYPRKEAWLSFFAKLTSENVIWKAQWMPLKAVIYRCGDFHSVPLLGPCGGVNYTPLLVLRQVWFKHLYHQLIICKSLIFHTILKIVKEKNVKQ